MESKRQQQVSELILRNYSYVLLQEGFNIYGNKPLVTVTQVKVATDLQLARIYLSIYNVEDKEAVLLQIKDNEFKLRHEMFKRLRHQLRRMPSIEYFIDDTLDEMYRVDALFKKLESNQLNTPLSASED